MKNYFAGRVALCCCLSMLLASCSPDDLNSAVLLPEKPSWTTVEVLRISAETENLVSFDAISPGPRGLIAITQRTDGRVVVYDSTGRRVVSVGGSGYGPGELIEPTVAGWIGDTLWTTSGGSNPDLVYFDLNGRHVRTQPRMRRYTGRYLGREVWFGNTHPLALNAELGVQVRSTTGIQGLPSVGDNSVSAFSADGVLQSVLLVSGPSEHPGLNIPYYWRPIRAVSQDGSIAAMITSHSAAMERGIFRLTTVSITGDTLINRAYRTTVLERITPSQADRLVKFIDERSAQPLSASTTRLIPSFHQPYHHYFSAASDGTVWLSMRSIERTRLWVALDRNGDVLGSLMLPALGRISDVRDDLVWAMDENPDTGLRDAVVLKVVRLPPGR